ncbi:MAG TPA: hypothetical protein VL307_10035 [Chitinophagaceae bacterium]|nr:hypothetical protein [Chitinophagaceae bacterium]
MPAADGSIKVKHDNNGNYSINVNVIHLAAPEQLTPAKKTYVVWVNTKEHGQKNLGKLAIHTGLFSKSLKGSLQTVTPYKPESIYITAEDEGNRTYPGPQVVLTTGTLN